MRVEASDADGAGEGTASRAAAFASLGALLLVLALALALAGVVGRRTFAALPPNGGNVWTRHAIDSALEQLPKIARQPGDVAIAVGASQTYYGFYPPAFDEALTRRSAAITSYNLAALAWTPFTVRLWTRRIAAALEAEGKRARVFFVGVTPHLLTRATTEHARWETINLPAQARFAGPTEIALVALRSPDQAARLLTTRAVGLTPSLMRDASARWLRGEDFPRALPAEWTLPEDFPRWPEATRGGQPELVTYASREERVALMRRHLNARIRQSGILRLELDETAIEDVIATVETAARVADHVFVLVTPRNEAIVRTSEPALARLDRALETIADRTSATVLDYYRHDPRFDLEDFLDATHLDGVEARARFSRILANDVADALGLGLDGSASALARTDAR